MQVNDPKHTSKFRQRYIKNKEKQHIHQLMSWPAQIADLNPIELLWDERDWKVRAKQATNATDTWQLLQESLAVFSSVCVQSLFERMPRICDAVKAVKGGHFDESKV